MTELKTAADTPVELSADEIAYVAGGNGLVGPGAGKDGSQIGSGG